MTKKAYMKPAMNVVKIQQRASILTASNNDGVNSTLQEEEVTSAWTKRNSDYDVWNDDWSK